MQPRKKTSFVGVALLCVAEILLLGGIWWGILNQTAGMNRAVNDISELKDPSPFRAALMGHLGKLQLALQGYLRTSDASLADQMTQSRNEFEASLPEFEKQNPRLFPRTAVEEIRRAFGVYKGAIDHTLEVNARRQKNRGALDQNFSRIIFLIVQNIKPLIRNDQADGEERGEALLNVENQARAWQQNLAKAWAQPSHAATELAMENDNRGETFLDRYARLELLPRERKLEKEIMKLWQANGDLARESFAMEQVLTQSETFMNSQRALVVSALSKYLPPMPPAELEARKRGYIRSMRLHIVVACVMVLLGLISLRFAIIGVYHLLRGEPIVKKKPPRSAEDPTAPGVTVQMDLKGTIITWTSAAETLYGYRLNEMRGQSISKLFESESEISRLYKDLLDAPQTTFETIHKTKAGTAVPVRIEFRPVTDTAGRVTAIGLICKHR